MPRFTNAALDLDVEICSLTQRQAVPYWRCISDADSATGPEMWAAVLRGAKEGKWFVEDLDPLDFTPAQARFLAEELASHLLEASQIPEA